MEQLELHLTGIAPMLMHAPRTVNPLDEITVEIKGYTSKRKKTEEDHRTIARLEWEAGLYHDSALGPYIPSANVEICLRDAGKITRQGTAVTRGVIVSEDKLPLVYTGPRGTNGHGTQELWDANYKDIRRVGNQQNSIMRCRPMFPSWSIKVPILLEPSILDRRDLLELADRAGRMIGLGDYRPRFGRFTVEDV